MRVIARSLCVALLALLGTVGVTVAWTMTTAVQLQAATALIMGGADHPLMGPKDSPAFVTAYLNNAVSGYINSPAAASTGTAGPVDNAVAITYPAEFFPVFGSKTFDRTVAEGRENLHNCLDDVGCDFNQDVGSVYPPPPGDALVVLGYSESAVVASLVKRDLVDNYVPGHTTSFFLISNPMRGNGGVLMRGNGLPTIPFFGITFYGATPTDSAVLDDGSFAYPTVDVAQQYDIFGGDAPYRPLNLLATINSLAAYFYLHGDVIDRPLTDAEYQGQLGDTTYYLYPARTLPILMPLEQLGVPSPIVRFLDTVTRVAVEDAYLRGVNPGVPTAASLLPIGNPITLAVNLLTAVPVGIDDALQEMGFGRPLGTTPAGPYGVGGPPLPDPPSTTTTTTSSTSAGGDDDSGESVAPEARSLLGEEPGEPVRDPEPVTDSEPVAETVDESKSVEPETEPQELAKTTTPETKKPPAATEPDRPKVRGPIEFNSPEPQPDSPPTEPEEDKDRETAPDPSPPDEDQEAA